MGKRRLPTGRMGLSPLADARLRFAALLQGPLQRSRGGDARAHTAPPGALPPADRSTRSAARGEAAGAAACDAVEGRAGAFAPRGSSSGRPRGRVGGAAGCRGSAAPGLPRAGGPVELGLVPGPAPPAARRDGPSRAGRALPLLSRRFRLQVSLAAAPLRRSRSSPLRALGRFLSTLKSVSGGGRRAGVAAAAAPIATGWGVGDRSVSPSGRRPNATGPAGRAAGRDRRAAGGAWGGKWMRREEERSGGTRRDRRRGESGRR